MFLSTSGAKIEFMYFFQPWNDVVANILHAGNAPGRPLSFYVFGNVKIIYENTVKLKNCTIAIIILARMSKDYGLNFWIGAVNHTYRKSIWPTFFCEVEIASTIAVNFLFDLVEKWLPRLTFLDWVGGYEKETSNWRFSWQLLTPSLKVTTDIF